MGNQQVGQVKEEVTEDPLGATEAEEMRRFLEVRGKLKVGPPPSEVALLLTHSG
jgi:hypothetical protein